MKNKLLIQELENKYKDTKFYIKENDDGIEILYDNKKYINDDDFLDNIFDILTKFLTDDELWYCVISYDLFGDINKF